jgi:magnesium transporter
MTAEGLDAALTRRHTPVSSGTPGEIVVASLSGGALAEHEGDECLTVLPGLVEDDAAAIWVDLAAPSLDQVQAIGSALRLHPLIVEDILEGNQRAKVESTNGVIHLVLFALSHGRRFAASEIDLVLGKGFLLTVHDGGWNPRATHHLRSGLASVMERGPDHLLWALCDDIVDGYFPFADVLGDEIDRVQDAIIADPSRRSLQELFAIKRELIEVRRAAAPTREVFSQLTNRDLALIDAEEIVYFRDVYDHVIRLTDEMDSYREIASSTLEVYLTQINNQLSVIMKRLTGVTVILAGIGAVAGLFGMSEATVEAGNFWLVTGIIIGLAALAAVVLRRIDWL